MGIHTAHEQGSYNRTERYAIYDKIIEKDINKLTEFGLGEDV